MKIPKKEVYELNGDDMHVVLISQLRYHTITVYDFVDAIIQIGIIKKSERNKKIKWLQANDCY